MTISLTTINRAAAGDTVYAGFGTCNTNFGLIETAVNTGLQHTLTKKTASYTVATTDLTGMTTFTNDGASGTVTFTLPAGAANYEVGFYVTDAQSLKVVAAGSDKFRYGSTQGAAGGYIQSSEVGTHWRIKWTGDDWAITILCGFVKYDE